MIFDPVIYRLPGPGLLAAYSVHSTPVSPGCSVNLSEKTCTPIARHRMGSEATHQCNHSEFSAETSIPDLSSAALFIHWGCVLR